MTGTERVEIDLAAPATVADLLEATREKYPALRNYERSTLVARDREFMDLTQEVLEGDEICFLPPVMGG